MSFLIMSGQRAWRSGAGKNGAEEVHSPFISDYIDRRERQGNFRAWTAGGGEDGGYASTWSRSLIWGGRARPVAPVEAQYEDVTADGAGGFYYAVNFGVVGGLFHQNPAGEERRLFHRERFRCDGLAFQPAERRFAAALDNDGPTHIALLDENGRQTRWLTEGDCVDARPSWDPARPDTVLYQTCGMARRADGRAEFSPWEIMELSVDKGEIVPLWRREGMDVMLPRRDGRGRLYALVRPHGDAPLSWWEFLKRVALMPWILAQAVFGFVNAFTTLFAQKPLWKAGGPLEKVDTAPTIRVLGKQLETEALRRRKEKNPGESPSLAPASWQLWRRDPDGSEHKLAENVSWFALDGEGTPYYTTGLAIHALVDGAKRTVYEGPLIESFVSLK